MEFVAPIATNHVFVDGWLAFFWMVLLSNSIAAVRHAIDINEKRRIKLESAHVSAVADGETRSRELNKLVSYLRLVFFISLTICFFITTLLKWGPEGGLALGIGTLIFLALALIERRIDRANQRGLQ